MIVGVYNKKILFRKELQKIEFHKDVLDLDVNAINYYYVPAGNHKHFFLSLELGDDLDEELVSVYSQNSKYLLESQKAKIILDKLITIIKTNKQFVKVTTIFSNEEYRAKALDILRLKYRELNLKISKDVNAIYTINKLFNLPLNIIEKQLIDELESVYTHKEAKDVLFLIINSNYIYIYPDAILHGVKDNVNIIFIPRKIYDVMAMNIKE